MPKSSDGCLERPRQKTAGVTIYLMEELGDARLRCDQLVRYLDEAVKLIEKSSHKDHFFEVAGHLIQGIPDAAFRLQKALQAVALAADRLDYEEIKQELRPEKVEELERVLKEVRIRQVQHRSEPGATPMTPQKAAQRLREIAKTAREEGSLPFHELASLVRDLTPARKAHDHLPVADTLERIAATVEGSDKISRGQLSALLSRIAMEAEFNAALKLASKPRLTQEMMQLGDVEEVKQKFKAENPDISDADLNEIAKQWQTNKDVVKDKTALSGDGNPLLLNFDNIRTMAIQANRMADGGRWRLAMMSLFSIVDEMGTILVQLGEVDTQKSEALKRQLRQAIPAAMHMDRIPGAGQDVSVMESVGDPFSLTAGEGDLQPIDRSLVTNGLQEIKTSIMKAMTDENAANYKKMFFHLLGVLDGVGQVGRAFDVDGIGYVMRVWKSFAALSGARPTTNFSASSDDGITWKATPVMAFGADDHFSKFEEGKPADPTENLSPEDAKKWKEEHDKHKDNFKAANTADEARRSRFEQGQPADPTENLNPADAKEWKEQHDKHKDNFKEASGRTTHLEGKSGHTLCGEKAYPDTIVGSVKDATCHYCTQAWKKSHGGLTAALEWKA
jgi:hypothetical protein